MPCRMAPKNDACLLEQEINKQREIPQKMLLKLSYLAIGMASKPTYTRETAAEIKNYDGHTWTVAQTGCFSYRNSAGGNA